MTIRNKDLEEIVQGNGSSPFSPRELAQEALDARRESIQLELELRELRDRCGHGRLGIPELDHAGSLVLDEQGIPKLNRR